VKNIVFENLQINGKVVLDVMSGKPKIDKMIEPGGIFVGEHVEGVVFKNGTK
jgi:hypothetical protein